MTMLSVKEYERMLERDHARCIHCGTTVGLVPNHRRNRGMGGSKAREVPSNVVTMCSSMNGQIESNPELRLWAVAKGWKLLEGDDPRSVPCFDAIDCKWFVLDDTWSRVEIKL